LLKPLDDVFVANAVYLVHRVKTDTDFTQFRSKKILNDLANFLDNTHDLLCSLSNFTPVFCPITEYESY
jgi:hypothetical protein